MSSVAEKIEKLKAKFDPKAAEGLDLTFQFTITDAESYCLTVRDATCDIQPGSNHDADVTLIMDQATLEEIVKGELDGMQAFMSGRLRTEGNMMLAMKLGQLFSL